MYIANNETAVSSKGILNYMPQGDTAIYVRCKS